MASPPDPKRASDVRRAGTDVSSSEDFLFHLYRGSELLQDDRVHDAKEELEAALRLQPMDSKGQDLLAVVYFRLGMYPRAIEIFEQLVRDHPDERTPRTNLALCYLKTGQPVLARQLLEEAVRRNEENPRAWAYLGLACERLGDYAKAREAFGRGGHEAMVRRMDELLGSQAEAGDESASRPPPTFEEIDEVLAAGPPSHRPSASHRPMPRISRPPAASTRQPSYAPAPVSLGAERAPSALPPPPTSPSDIDSMLPREGLPGIDALARAAVMVFPRDAGVQLDAAGLVRVTSKGAFAVRMDLLRAADHPQGGGVVSDVLSRRARGRDQDEPLGGVSSPLVALRGASHLLLGPRLGRTLLPFSLEETVYLREDALAGFDASLSYENGRLAVGEGDALAMVQLRGVGQVVLQLHGPLSSLEVTPDGALSVRREMVLGWVGRLVPRALGLSEAPAGQRGLVLFSGDGLVLLDPARGAGGGH